MINNWLAWWCRIRYISCTSYVDKVTSRYLPMTFSHLFTTALLILSSNIPPTTKASSELLIFASDGKIDSSGQIDSHQLHRSYTCNFFDSVHCTVTCRLSANSDSKVSLRAVCDWFLSLFSFLHFLGFSVQITKSDPHIYYNHCNVMASHFANNMSPVTVQWHGCREWNCFLLWWIAHH